MGSEQTEWVDPLLSSTEVGEWREYVPKRGRARGYEKALGECSQAIIEVLERLTG